MKKVVLFIVILLLATSFAFSEVVILKTGEVIKGTIVISDETSLTIESALGILTIKKSDIEKLYYDDYAYEEDDLGSLYDESIEEQTEEEIEKEEQRSNLIYQFHRTTKKIGIGLLIPGSILTLGALIWGTPPVVMYVQNNYYSLTNSTNYYDNSMFYTGLSFYISFLASGLILDVISIVSIVVSVKYFRKWKNISKVSLYAGYKTGPFIGMKYKF